MNAITEKRPSVEESLSEACLVFYNHTDSLFRLAYFLTGSELQAEDCFHSALEKTRHHLRSYGSCSAKAARSYVIQAGLEAVLQKQKPLKARATAQSKALLKLFQLNDLERVSFVLRRVERYALTEVASLLGLTMNQLETLLAGAQEKLLCTVEENFPKVCDQEEEVFCWSC